MPETQKEPAKKSYSDTVHLPKTDFPMKGDLPKREPGWLAMWEEKGVYQRMLGKAEGRPAFVLHDGPPYANGHTHIGHALNKILKDMTVKSQALMGKRAPYVPGWDCHGLPIEHALLKEKKMSKRGVKDVNEFRAEARAFAQRFIDIQRDEFRRMGVLGDWTRPYTTMSKEYEAAIVGAFRRLYAEGYIYRGLKAVTWCVTCETALAEAEVEYKDKTSPSVYVALPVKSFDHEAVMAQNDMRLMDVLQNAGAAVLVWTTTPWTLPANMAVAFNPAFTYALVRAKGPFGERVLFVAEARLQAVLGELGAAAEEKLGVWTGTQLAGAKLVCQTPLAYVEGFPRKDSRAVLADYVTADDGTGIVHTAPGHGVDDFNTGKKNGIEIFCPVDGSGHFTADAGPFAGKRLFDEANEAVIAELKASGRLLAEKKISHSYPHCWRCKNPIAFRATEQWFLGVNHEGLRERLLAAIAGVKWIPAVGEARISAMVQNRPDWCLSRQRLWGTPIPMLRCVYCRDYLKDDAVLAAVEGKIRRDGSDFWFAQPGRMVAPKDWQMNASVHGTADKPMPKEALNAMPWDFLPEGARCANRECGKQVFERETDILDVWVDSGASWLGVLKEQGLEYPCDLYLEGSDQHRGWFQSSLVLSTALEGKAPYKKVLTHGFVLDDKGRAMHKSMGNVVSPHEVISKFGADVLRLWVALADYSDDVRISDKLLEGPVETYRKIRNTLRYLLGNVCDFDPAKDAVSLARMPERERYVLHRLAALDAEVRQAYADFAFRKAATALVDFCNLDLSAFYLDTRKDALYTLKADDPARRAAQTAMWECLARLVLLAAPILSFTCEEVWQELRGRLQAAGSSWKAEESVFLQDAAPAPAAWTDPALAARWAAVLKVREEALKALEAKRAAKVLGAPREAIVTLKGPGLDVLSAEEWAEILLVSEARLEAGPEPLAVAAEKTAAPKCPRCWRHRADAGRSKEDPDLCARCVSQLAA